MNHKKKLSIIIPVYNVESYIEQCLLSVDKAYFYDMEIIIVNDGSTDSSLDIVNNFEFKNEVLIYSQDNKGLSASRNKGIEIASGEYIVFLDSDDFVTDDYISCIRSNIYSSNYDVISFGCFTSNELGENITQWGGQVVGDYDVENMNTISIMEKYFYISQWYAWKFVFKREVFNFFSFPEGKRFEDLLTIPNVLLRQSKVKFINDRLVIYRRRSSSITRNITQQDIDHVTEYFDGIDFPNKKLEQIHKTNTYLLLCSMVFNLGKIDNLRKIKKVSAIIDVNNFGYKAFIYKHFPYLIFYIMTIKRWLNK